MTKYIKPVTVIMRPRQVDIIHKALVVYRAQIGLLTPEEEEELEALIDRSNKNNEELYSAPDTLNSWAP